MALENIFYWFCGQYPLIIYPISSIIQELPAHKRQVNGVKFSCDAKRVVSCGSDFYMKVIDLQTGTILFSKGKLSIKLVHVLLYDIFVRYFRMKILSTFLTEKKPCFKPTDQT